MQLSSLASSALELQLLPLVLRNLITTTPNSTYMYIMIRHSHSATIFEVYLLVSITDINSNHDSMTKVWQHCVVLPFRKNVNDVSIFMRWFSQGKNWDWRTAFLWNAFRHRDHGEREKKNGIWSISIRSVFKFNLKCR